MSYFLKYWKDNKSKINPENIFIFFDFDGTLAPIVSHPRLAKLSNKDKNLLQRISKKYAGKVALISGRQLKDLRARVGLKNLIYAGNHGFEIFGIPKIKIPGLDKTYFDSIKIIVKQMRKSLRAIPGVYIEDKRETVSVHYRNVTPKNASLVKKIIEDIVANAPRSKLIEVKSGKKVIEIRPKIKWNKGTASKLILKYQQRKFKKTSPWTAIYIGDDVTDEDAFKQLGARALTVRVGMKKQTAARFYLRRQDEVALFLKELAQW